MSLLADIAWDDLDMEAVLANSYRDFHAKGIDYVCLHRDPQRILKAYFFEGKTETATEVVNPHDHRGAFMTECVSGTIRNRWFRIPPCWDGESIGTVCSDLYNVFEWRTPLNGGNGFTPLGDVPLQQYKHQDFGPCGMYYMTAKELHTIQVMQPETCIVLAQYADEMPVEVPTHTFSRSPEAPDPTGLYNNFTADQAMKRINLLKGLIHA